MTIDSNLEKTSIGVSIPGFLFNIPESEIGPRLN